MKYYAAFFLLYLSLSPMPALQLNSGHNRPITALTHDSTYLYSGDEKGQLKVWTSQGALVINMKVSDTKILSLVPNHARHHIAVLTSAAPTEFRLSIWEWNRGRELFHISLHDRPQDISFSPSGTHLLYSSLNEITAVYAKTGHVARFLSPTFLGSSRFVLSKSEQRIMTYSEFSGTIEYRTTDTATLLRSVPTLDSISELTLTENTRYASGIHEHDIVLIDIVEGSLLSRIVFENIRFFAADGDYIAVLSEQRGAFTYSLILREDSSLRVLHSSLLDARIGASFILQWGGSTFLGDEMGTIYSLQANTQKVFARSILQPIHQFTYRNNNIRYTVGTQLYLLTSPLTQFLEQKLRVLPLSQKPLRNEAPRIDISENLITLYDENNIELFSYTDLGIQSALYLQEKGQLVIGFSNTRNYGSALILVKVGTLETVLIETDLFYIVDTAYDEENSILWIAGIDTEGHTILEGRKGDVFSQQWQEASITGEVFSLQIHPLSKEESAALVNAGQKEIYWHRNIGNNKKLSDLSRNYEKIDLQNNILVGLTIDGSLEFVHTGHGDTLAEFFHLDVSSWAIIATTWTDMWNVDPSQISNYDTRKLLP